MKTLSVQTEIENLENELELQSALGKYFSDEAQALKIILWELRAKEIINPFL